MNSGDLDIDAVAKAVASACANGTAADFGTDIVDPAQTGDIGAAVRLSG